MNLFLKIALLTSFLFSSHVFAQSDNEESDSNDLRRLYISKQTVEIANKILNNEIYLGKAFESYQTKSGITWDENPFKNETWCFYFQSLDLIGQLSNAYEVTSDPKYLIEAKKLIESWSRKNISFYTNITWAVEKYIYKFRYIRSRTSHCVVWDDHSAANRVTNFIQFYSNYKNSKIVDSLFTKKLENILYLHGKYLSQAANYNSINNHGIFQDRSLLQLVYMFPNLKNANDWYKISSNRLIERIGRDVTESGVHKEHSPMYHFIVLNLFKDIIEFMRADDLNKLKLDLVIRKMEHYLTYLAKPNGETPNIGDSSPSKVRKYVADSNIDENLQFVLSNEKFGKKPNDNIFLPDAGVAIFRNGWLNKKYFYLMFTAGFHSFVHKHADDLSFVLSLGLTDFFIDSGKYNYNESDPYRKYFRSTLAHNTITVDDQSYLINTENAGKSKITSFGETADASYVTGEHTCYNGVTITRTLIYAKNKFVLIHDQITSKDNHKYTQSFQIGPNITIDQKENHITLTSKRDRQKMDLFQIGNFEKMEINRGRENAIQGWLSSQLNKKEPISSIQFIQHGQSAEFKTVIALNPNLKISQFTVNDAQSSKTIHIVKKNRTSIELTIPKTIF